MEKRLKASSRIGCHAHIGPQGPGWACERGANAQQTINSHHHPPIPRSGLTFIDLLVSIAVIAVLIALLLPAVQQAREAARRSQCKNNLCQIVFALQNYANTHRTFPPGTVNATGPIVNKPSPDAYHVSWTVQVLPHLELSTVFNHFDFTQGVYSRRNLAPQQRRIETFVCPSNKPPIPKGVRGVSHYAGVHHSSTAPIDIDNDGILHLNSRVRPADITDGLSHTLIVGEKTDRKCIWGWASGTDDTLRNTGLLMDFSIPGVGSNFSSREEYTQLELKDIDLDLVTGAFNSNHTGGAQFALADGSVRFISQNLNSRIRQQLASRDDGAMPGEF